MDKYLLIKMLYLADRAAIDRWGDPITCDSPFSMPYGPVLSTIYNLTKGESLPYQAEWSKIISEAGFETNQVLLLADPGTEELSQAEVAILTAVFEKFKRYSWKEMKDFSHKLPEYEEVKGSKRIAFATILKALGKTDQEIDGITERLKQASLAEALLA